MHSELEGYEFDWFAIDDNGQIALFATAGEGFIPANVLENHTDHSELSEKLNTPNYGTRLVWQDYASVGLYVFDWSLPGGPYKKQASPNTNATEQLRLEIQSIRDLPKISGSFSNLSEIKSWLLGT